MRSSAFIGITVLLSTVILVLFGISALSPLEPKTDNANQQTGATALDRPTVEFGNPYKGPQNASVTIVEFGDYLCSPCATLDETLNLLLADFPNDLRVVWKDFPNTDAHPDALSAAEAARCAGAQGKFWQYHDLLMEDQISINATNYLVYAEKLGLDSSQLKQCLDDETTRPIIERDFDEGQRLRIDGTPYLFINDRRVSGAIDYDSLHTLVSSALTASIGGSADVNAGANANVNSSAPPK